MLIRSGSDFTTFFGPVVCFLLLRCPNRQFKTLLKYSNFQSLSERCHKIRSKDRAVQGERHPFIDHSTDTVHNELCRSKVCVYYSTAWSHLIITMGPIYVALSFSTSVRVCCCVLSFLLNIIRFVQNCLPPPSFFDCNKESHNNRSAITSPLF